MRSLTLNCTLKSSPEVSNTEALAKVLMATFEQQRVETEMLRMADFRIHPGVSSDEGDGDEWPQIRSRILNAEIPVMASPTWLGQPSRIAKRVLERMDAMLSETDADQRPVAYNRVAGVVVTGNEDGAHQVISEISGATRRHRVYRAGPIMDLLERWSRGRARVPHTDMIGRIALRVWPRVISSPSREL